MKKMITTTLLSVGFALTAHADRLLYTSEMVESATVIGTWRIQDTTNLSERIVLQKPTRLFKGDPLTLGKRIYSRRLQDAVTGITGKGTVLFIRVDGDRADLVADLAFIPNDDMAEQVVSRTISQFDLRAKWDTMTVREQIDHSDVIVVGSFMHFGHEQEVPEDTDPTIKVETRSRGESTDEIMVLPNGVSLAQGKFLFFIQHYSGSGPNYMLMSYIPIQRATEHLKFIKMTEPQPPAGGQGKPAPQP